LQPVIRCNIYNISLINPISNTDPNGKKSKTMKTFTSKIQILLAFVAFSATAYSQPLLNSLPSPGPTTATIYLDFNGQSVQSPAWNGGQRLDCAAAPMNDAQITEVFERVSEDYRPFNVNITTDEAKFLLAPLTKRIRVIVTPTSAWKPGVGGIAYVGSFTWGDDTPAFVFCDRLGPNSPKFVGECCSHESGHTVGLSHQSSYDSLCNLTATYNLGTGPNSPAETGWAPIMGNSYYKNFTGWNFGPTNYGCNNTQDNLTIITTQNGFTYRTDDFTETLGAGTYSLGSTAFNLNGLITTTTDNDAFKYTVGTTSTFHFDAKPTSVATNNNGSNLDVQVMMYNGATLIGTYNPTNTLNVVIDTTLNAGTYYFVVTGVGNAYVTDYGSLGSYTITGFNGPVPIHDVALTGNTVKNKHNLSWNIIADESIKSQVMEVSEDAVRYTRLSDFTPSTKGFSYAPYQNSTLYYRLKVTSVINQTVYSNVVALRAAGNQEKLYSVSTFVHDEIVVNAAENYQYRLSDANGRLVATGNGTKGVNRINVNSIPGGMYIIQLVNNNQKQTDRIIKQ